MLQIVKNGWLLLFKSKEENLLIQTPIVHRHLYFKAYFDLSGLSSHFIALISGGS